MVQIIKIFSGKPHTTVAQTTSILNLFPMAKSYPLKCPETSTPPHPSQKTGLCGARGFLIQCEHFRLLFGIGRLVLRLPYIIALLCLTWSNLPENHHHLYFSSPTFVFRTSSPLLHIGATTQSMMRPPLSGLYPELAPSMRSAQLISLSSRLASPSPRK